MESMYGDPRFVVEDFGDEAIVYDTVSHQAHHLNQAARLVWSLGTTHSREEIAGRLQEQFGLPNDPSVVQLALKQLHDAGLVRGTLEDDAKISRRLVIQGLGVTAGAAALLPLVATIVAPTPAMAASFHVSGR